MRGTGKDNDDFENMSGPDFCSITSTIVFQSEFDLPQLCTRLMRLRSKVALELTYIYILTNERECHLFSVTMQTISHGVKIFVGEPTCSPRLNQHARNST